MKKNIHPNYRPVIFLDAAANFSFLTRSTVKATETMKWTDGETYPVYRLEISSASHPFFTGKMKFVDSTGQIDRFRKRFGQDYRAKAAAKPEVKPAKKRDRE
jgi:large subunit ribosomal protein L31